MMPLRTRIVMRRLPRAIRRRLSLRALAVDNRALPVDEQVLPPARPRPLINLAAAPSAMEQRAAGWRGG